MQTDSRQSYLDELGLTLWQLRSYARAPSEVDESRQAEVCPAPALADQQAHIAPELEPGPAPDLPEEASSNVADMDWDALQAELARRDYRGASRPVFGVGAKDAPLMIIGEAPGAEEDRQGEPFVGRAGKLLDRMLFAIGHDRERNTYIANICKFRPPNNRDPNPDEVAADRPILERQIALLQPRLIVALGRVAAQTLLHSTANLGAMRGSLHRYPGLGIPVLVSYHPAYLLRSPQAKAKSWDDLKKIKKILNESEI